MTDTTKPSAIVRTPADNILLHVGASKARIENILPKHLSLDRFLAQVGLAVRSSHGIQQCRPETVVQAVMDAAELGLDPSGRLGSSYIVQYKDEAKLIPGYRGLIDLAVRSGEVKKIEAHLVNWRDSFDYEEGEKPKLWHKPWTPAGPEEALVDPWAGAPKDVLRCAYAVVTLTSGLRLFEVMAFVELEKIRNRSASARHPKSPWNHKDDQWQMYRKCPVRRVCKFVPLSPEKSRDLARALALEDAAEFVDEPEPGVKTDIHPTSSQRVTEKLAKRKTMNEQLREQEIAEGELVSEPPADVVLPGQSGYKPT